MAQRIAVGCCKIRREGDGGGGEIGQFFLAQTDVKLPSFNNQIMSDNGGICATGWLGLMLSDFTLVSHIVSEQVTWRQQIHHWECSLFAPLSLRALSHVRLPINSRDLAFTHL
jgi:hypothetical protein